MMERSDKALISNPKYNSFLVQMRLLESEDQPTWVFSLHSAQTGEKLFFAGLDGLVSYLQNELGGYSRPGELDLPQLPGRQAGQLQ